MKLMGWGRLSQSEAEMTFLNRKEVLKTDKNYLAIGNCRSYGDVCLNTNQVVVKMTTLDYFSNFDEITGILECEAGVILKDIQDIFLPRGWILPVTPGTQLITVGGAIANDVHGKNHHIRGSFGHHVLGFELLRLGQEVMHCSREQNADLFHATIGGIGLTGIIVKAKIQLKKIPSEYVRVEYLPFRGIEEFMALTHQSNEQWEYTVSWIDCLSGKNVRGVFMRANHVEAIEVANRVVTQAKVKTIPIVPPISCINLLSLKVFNQLYYHLNQGKKSHYQHFYSFQYPLDGISNWNVLYGKKGFYQYQCVIPWQYAQVAIEALLELIREAQQGSFLVVLKAFGEMENEGLLSFPLSGITLALDFPNLGEKTLNLFTDFDAIVKQYQGRLYLAKDARMDEVFFKQSYINAQNFEKYRDAKISSDMSKRLFGK